MREVRYGWRVGGEPLVTTQGGYWLVPHVEELVQALEAAYVHAADFRGEARKHALQYDADRVFSEHWEPFLE